MVWECLCVCVRTYARTRIAWNELIRVYANIVHTLSSFQFVTLQTDLSVVNAASGLCPDQGRGPFIVLIHACFVCVCSGNRGTWNSKQCNRWKKTRGLSKCTTCTLPTFLRKSPPSPPSQFARKAFLVSEGWGQNILIALMLVIDCVVL